MLHANVVLPEQPWIHFCEVHSIVAELRREWLDYRCPDFRLDSAIGCVLRDLSLDQSRNKLDHFFLLALRQGCQITCGRNQPLSSSHDFHPPRQTYYIRTNGQVWGLPWKKSHELPPGYHNERVPMSLKRGCLSMSAVLEPGLDENLVAIPGM